MNRYIITSEYWKGLAKKVFVIAILISKIVIFRLENKMTDSLYEIKLIFIEISERLFNFQMFVFSMDDRAADLSNDLNLS